jgi:hypothetical protein
MCLHDMKRGKQASLLRKIKLNDFCFLILCHTIRQVLFKLCYKLGIFCFIRQLNFRCENQRHFAVIEHAGIMLTLYSTISSGNVGEFLSLFPFSPLSNVQSTKIHPRAFIHKTKIFGFFHSIYLLMHSSYDYAYI